MKNFKQWIKDKLFDLLSRLSPTEQPTPDELRAWALEEAQKPPQSQIWIDPTIRSYPQPPVLHYPTGALARGWHGLEVTGVHPTITGVLKRIRVVRENTEPIDPKKDFPDWLNSAVEHMTPAEIERVPTIRDLAPKFDPDDTNEVPAIVKMLHQDRYEAHRHTA